MATYQGTLPQVFSFCISIPKPHAWQCVGYLMQNDSSFAVTVDTLPGQVKLWLSDTSYRDLERAGLL